MIVGVSGFAQHGKDSVAAVLVEEFGFVRVGFADALKELAYRVNPHIPGYGDLEDLVRIEGWESAKEYPRVRRFLQDLGTNARDMLGENVWVEALDRTLRNRGYGLFVVPDTRFPNEAQYIKDMGGQLWNVHRPDFDNGLGTDHVSEQHADSLGAVVQFVNTGSLEDLAGMVCCVATENLGLKPVHSE